MPLQNTHRPLLDTGVHEWPFALTMNIPGLELTQAFCFNPPFFLRFLPFAEFSAGCFQGVEFDFGFNTGSITISNTAATTPSKNTPARKSTTPKRENGPMKALFYIPSTKIIPHPNTKRGRFHRHRRVYRNHTVKITAAFPDNRYFTPTG